MAPQFPFGLTGLQEEIAARKLVMPLSALKSQADKSPSLRDVLGPLEADGTCVIAELPGISWSGKSHQYSDIPAVLDLFERAGVSMVANFSFSYAAAPEVPNPRELRKLTEFPTISRDIVIDPYQLHELRAFGTDMVTLYADLLDADQCASLVERAQNLGMEPLIEITSKADATQVADLGARVYAIDARIAHGSVADLKSFAELRSCLPSDARVIAVASLPTVVELIDLRRHGSDGVIISSGVLQQTDEYGVLRRLVAAGVHPAFQIPVPVAEE